MSYPDRLLEILREREHLLARCDAQRVELATIARQSAGAIKIVDRVVGVIRCFRSHPMLLGVAVAALVVIQRRSLWRWVRRGFVLWRTYRVFGNSKHRV